MDRLSLVQRNVIEVVAETELKALLKRKSNPQAYVGFEPSGLMHIGQGIILADKIKDLTKAGFDFTVLIADWHAYINDKLKGDLEHIALCGKYVEDCFLALGVDRTKVKFIYANELTGKKEYWETVLRISKNSSIARMRRAMSIMGRKEEDADIDASKLIYPAMQVTDIFELNVDIALGGMDQRHAHMLARDVASKLKRKKIIALHTPLLTGLQGGGRMEFDAKMSKSKPKSCIFIHDTPDDVKAKVDKAYCPPKQLEGNPIIEIWKYIIFNRFDSATIEREERFGGPLTFNDFASLSRRFSTGELHPRDLKNATSRYLDEILDPIRRFFEVNPTSYKKLLDVIGKGIKAPTR